MRPLSFVSAMERVYKLHTHENNDTSVICTTTTGLFPQATATMLQLPNTQFDSWEDCVDQNGELRLSLGTIRDDK